MSSHNNYERNLSSTLSNVWCTDLKDHKAATLTPVESDSVESVKQDCMTTTDGSFLIQSNDVERGYYNHVYDNLSFSNVNRSSNENSKSLNERVSPDSLPASENDSMVILDHDIADAEAQREVVRNPVKRRGSQSKQSGFNFMRLFGISTENKKSRSRRYSASSVEGSSTLIEILSVSNAQNEEAQVYSREIELSHCETSLRRQQSSPLSDLSLSATKDVTQSISNKLHSLWNSMKFGWNMKTGLNLLPNVPIYLLGNSYIKKANDIGLPRNSSCDTLINYTSDSFESFCRDYASRIWFTYRSGFSPIPIKLDKTEDKTKIGPLSHRRDSNSRRRSLDIPDSRLASIIQTSDCGWGCMVRCGQMMLAQAFTLHFLGRNWSLYEIPPPDSKTDEMHRHIIRWFGDSPEYPFSIHTLVNLSAKSPGERFGPVTLCRLIEQAMKQAAQLEPRLSEIAVYVVEDNVIYCDDLYELVGVSSERRRSTMRSFDASVSSIEQGVEALTVSSSTRSVLILLPLYLGGASGINDKTYSPVIQTMLRDRTCVGGLGGSPGHSVFMIGYQNNRLIHIDPHFCQKVVDVSQNNFPVESYHCLFPKTMQLKKLDPSCAFGFYCHSKRDLDEWLRRADTDLTANSAYPLIEVMWEGRNVRDVVSFSADSDSTCISVRSRSKSSRQSTTSDFIFL